MSVIQHHQRCHTDTTKKPKPFTLPQGFGQFEKGGFLIANGENTGYIYGAVRDKLSIFISAGCIENVDFVFETSFGPQATVVDCVWFPLKAELPGVAVLIHDTSLDKKEFYVAYLSLTRRKVLKKIILSYSAVSLFPACDGVRFRSQFSKLHHIFQHHWPHILAISVYGVGAILMHFGISDESGPVDEGFVKSPHTITLGKLFIDKTGERFSFKNEGEKGFAGAAKDLYVTCFQFIEKSGMMVMGFPFGGMFTVSLRNQKQKQYFLMEAIVEDITIQFADDDPRGLFYIWFVLARGQRYYAISAQCLFTEEDEKSASFDNPNLFFGLSFQLKDCIQFMSVRTVAVEKSKLAASGRASLDDSFIGSTKSLSLALYTWYGQPSEHEPIRIYGALFDLNMYYTKRVPNAINPDNSFFRQIPFVSGFLSDDSIDLKKVEIMDAVAKPDTFIAFSTTDSENIDQLFYPSAMSFTIHVLTSTHGFSMQVNSIQDEYLMIAGGDIPGIWDNPTEMCVKLHALGLCERPFEANDKRFYLLSTFLRHGYHGDVVNFIKKAETAFEDLKFISKWLSKEVENAKGKLDRNAEPLFRGDEVSHSSFYYITFSEMFFLRVLQILDALLKRMEELDKGEQVQLLTVAQTVAKGLHQYAIGIKFGCAFNFLPQKPFLNDVNLTLKKEFEQRCKNAAQKKKELNIVKLIADCMNATDNDSLWDHNTPEQWYPPENYASWLGILINVDLSISAKVSLIGYYLLDLDTLGLMTSPRLFESSLGYFLHLEHDKLIGIKRKVDRMYKTDIQNACEPMEEEVRVNPVARDSFEDKLARLEDIPLITREDAKRVKDQYLQLPHGIHYWNLLCVDKLKYDLIELTNDTPSVDEPEDVKKSRIEVHKIKEKYPWLFRENKFLPLVQKYFAGRESEIVPEPAKKIEVVPLKTKKRTIEEVDESIEENFVMVTPVKRSRKSMFIDTPAAKTFEHLQSDVSSDKSLSFSPVMNADVVKASVSKRQWDRIRMLTKTPPATPSVARNCSPEPSTPRVKPTSILKSNKPHSRLEETTKKNKLKFEDTIAEVRDIPNRFDLKAQQPDHFTMDDSVTSEADLTNEADAVVAPMILNWDDDGEDTIMVESDVHVGSSEFGSLNCVEDEPPKAIAVLPERMDEPVDESPERDDPPVNEPPSTLTNQPVNETAMLTDPPVNEPAMLVDPPALKKSTLVVPHVKGSPERAVTPSKKSSKRVDPAEVKLRRSPRLHKH